MMRHQQNLATCQRLFGQAVGNDSVTRLHQILPLGCWPFPVDWDETGVPEGWTGSSLFAH